MRRGSISCRWWPAVPFRWAGSCWMGSCLMGGCLMGGCLMGCGDEAGAGQPAATPLLQDAEGSAEGSVAANAEAQAEFYGLSQRVEIAVELAPEDWQALRQEGRSLIGTFLDPTGAHEYTYFDADVTIDGQRYENVAVRKKGYIGSLSADRPSLKIDLGRNGRELAHFGLDEITLNNDRQDPSHSHQCLAYGLFAAAGVPASRCGLAHVVVNGEDLGTYSNVEPIGKPLLARYFSDDGGNLYEGQITDFFAEQIDVFQLKTNEAANDRSDLRRLIGALDGDDAGLIERLEAVLDLEAFRTFWALETLVGHWDGYAGNNNNYYLYHDPSTERFTFLPWGTDSAFERRNPFDVLNTSIAVYARGRIANRLYAVPDQRRAYRERLAELAESVWGEADMATALDQIERLASDALPAAIAAQRELLTAHPAALRAELSQEAPEWIALPAGPVNPCPGGVSEIRGSFGTTWGTLAAPAPEAGTFSVEASIDGQPLEGAWVGGAGMDGMLADGIPRVRLLAQLSATRTLSLDLQLTVRSFGPGVVPFHGIETVAFVNAIDADGGFTLGGFVGDGQIELDQAGMQPGAPVAGRFSGRLLQLGCLRQ